MLMAGVYKFEIAVTDNGGLSSKDTVQIVVTETTPLNKPPVRNAGN
jgi:hypothetical protein